MRVLIITQYFPPEVGAAQQRLGYHATALARAGHEVRVVTALPSYPWGRTLDGYRRRLRVLEAWEGVTVTRYWTRPVSSGPSTWERMANYLSFPLIAGLPALLAARRADVALIETPPLTVAALGPLVASLGTPYVLYVSDLWPTSAVELGALTAGSRVARAAERLEGWVYRRAAGLIGVTEGVCAHIASRVPAERVHLIPNGVDPEAYVDANPGAGAADGSAFRLVYAGNVGLAAGLEVALEAVADLPDVHLRIVGDGAAKAGLLERARACPNVEFVPALPRGEALELLARADAALVTLQDRPFLRGAVPAKLLEAMAAGLPVVLAGRGEAADLVARAGCGIVAEPGSPAALRSAIEQMRMDPHRAERGRRGRAHVFATRDLRALNVEVQRVLEGAAA